MSDILNFINEKIDKTNDADEKLTPVKYKSNMYFKIIRDLLINIENDINTDFKIEIESKSDIQEMLDAQKKLNIAFKPDYYDLDWQIMYDKTTTAIIHELCEAQRETNYKYWTFNPQKPDFPKLKEELIDVLHFFLNLLLMVFNDAEEIKKEYFRKNNINCQRIQNGYVKNENNKI